MLAAPNSELCQISRDICLNSDVRQILRHNIWSLLVLNIYPSLGAVDVEDTFWGISATRTFCYYRPIQKHFNFFNLMEIVCSRSSAPARRECTLKESEGKCVFWWKEEDLNTVLTSHNFVFKDEKLSFRHFISKNSNASSLNWICWDGNW